jgi:tRNA pseudouridine13 synthase
MTAPTESAPYREHDASLLPVEPPFRFAELPLAGGRIGPAPEDFVVDEIPLYEASGEGDHWYVQIRKRCLNTADAQKLIANMGGVAERDIGRAGLKDFFAVTSQWLSVPAAAPDPTTWDWSDERLEMVSCSRHTNKLRPGHLMANQFRINVVDVSLDAADTVLQAIQDGGFYNVYGAQRFGRGGRNIDRALRWLTGPPSRNRKKNRLHASLYPSTLQSEFFNRYLAARSALGWDRLLLGEYVRLDGTGSYRQVADVDIERENLITRDYHLTGPLPGGRLRASTDEAIALEEQIWADFCMDADAREKLMREVGGTRRDLMIRPESMAWESIGPRSMSISFTLPPGAYATTLIREITRTPWFEESPNNHVSSDENE